MVEMYVVLLLWIPFLTLLSIYCRMEKHERFRAATTLKVILSAYVALMAVAAAARLDNVYGWLLAAGLICAVPADFFLQYIRADLRKFKLGILCFGAMHLCLLTGFFLTWGVGWQEFVIWALLLLVLGAFQLTQKWDMGPARVPLTIYTVLVTLMSAKAMAIVFVHPLDSTLALGVAGLFFYLSDLFLGIWNYHNDSFNNLVFNRVIYFGGQLLFAFHLILRVQELFPST